LESFREQQEAKAKKAEIAQMEAEREAARSKAWKMIAAANLGVIGLVALLVVLWRKWRAKKAVNDAGLDIPEA
ncbi:TIGR03503 family protein, partial [Vibrio natriegens]